MSAVPYLVSVIGYDTTKLPTAYSGIIIATGDKDENDVANLATLQGVVADITEVLVEPINDRTIKAIGLIALGRGLL